MVDMLILSVAAMAAEEAEPTALGFNPGAWVAIAMLVIFAIAIWKRVPSAIGKALDANIAKIRDQLAEAEALRRDAEALKAEYEAKAEAAGADAEAIVERAKDEAESILATAKSDAEALVARRGKMAEDRIAAEERSAIAELRSTTARAATTAAASLIAERHDAGSDKALVDQAIAGLGKR